MLEQMMQRPGVFGEFQEQLTRAGMRASSQRKVIGLVNAVLERGQRWHPEVLRYHHARGQFEPPSTKRKRLVRPLPLIAIERIREAILCRPVRDPLSRLFDAALVSCMGEGIACRPSELRLSATWDGIGARTLLLQAVVEPDERDDAEGLKTGARPARSRQGLNDHCRGWRGLASTTRGTAPCRWLSRAGYDQRQVARYAGHTIQTLAEIDQRVFDEYEGSDPIDMAELASDARRRVSDAPN